MIYHVLFSTIFCLVVNLVPAQSGRITDYNAVGWFNNFGAIEFSKKWSGHLEYQWRRDGFVNYWQQSLFRTGINYQIDKKFLLRVGYVLIETYPYGDIPIQKTGKRFPEHRIFQMAVLSDFIGKVDISHRFILEQRWIGRFINSGSTRPDEFVFLNRLRYMCRLQTSLSKKAKVDNTLYAAMYDEIFLGFGNNVNANVFDQNRLAILVGYRFNRNVRVEGGFFQQILQFGREINNRSVFQKNNGIIINNYFIFDMNRLGSK